MTPRDSKAARSWRLARKLSHADLAEKTGYAVETIYKYERLGLPSPAEGGVGRPRIHSPQTGAIEPWVWQRYRLACAGVEAEIRSGEKFEWR